MLILVLFRKSEIKPLPLELLGCFAEQSVAGQAEVSEEMVIELAQLSTRVRAFPPASQ
jgi:hypothetical protein